MTIKENVRKLADFCNNLGKEFRKLIEDTDSKFKKLEGQIKSLRDKNNILESKIKQKIEEDKTIVKGK